MSGFVIFYTYNFVAVCMYRYVGTSISSRYLFIVLEYVPGGSVAGTLSQFGAFSEPLIRYALISYFADSLEHEQ